ncbi:MAG TPA: helix-turn-helix transcriptional regulator [Methylomirabilota bacterium]|nr:helix-turn-helix transcriptional regulator [Methylomirabilota bacterium]
MDDQRIGRVILVLRQRRGWRQEDLSARSGVSQSAISDMERGRVDRYTLETARRVLRALDAMAALDVRWGGRGDIDRLLDADHARLVSSWADRHRREGWDVVNEASFSIYGERGRMDQLAFHHPTGTLEVTEAKTGIWDVQETLGSLDTKVRLAPKVAAQRAWRVRRVVGALVLADGRTVRRRIAEHEQLFARYATRGRAAYAFVRDPRQPAEGLLVFVSLSPTNQDRLRRAGQRRVRRSSTSLSVDPAATAVQTPFGLPKPTVIGT